MVYDFGYRLRELREKKKMTQAQVARKCNISKASSCGYENNIKTHSLDVLRRLCGIYEVSADYILGLTSRKMVSVDGLTPSQREVVEFVILEFKQNNKNLSRLS